MTQNDAIGNVEIRNGYYKSGALLNEAPYVNGEIHGIMKAYDEDKANIVCLALYDKGREVDYKKI